MAFLDNQGLLEPFSSAFPFPEFVEPQDHGFGKEYLVGIRQGIQPLKIFRILRERYRDKRRCRRKDCHARAARARPKQATDKNG